MDDGKLNPYQAPASDKPWRGRAVRVNPFTVPAIMIILIASSSLALFPVDGVRDIAEIVAEMKTSGEAAGAGSRRLLGSIVMLLVMIIGNIIALRGASHMLRLKKFRTAKIGAVAACIPFFSPCIFLGIPFGVWTLVIMNRPDVQAMFAQR